MDELRSLLLVLGCLYLTFTVVHQRMQTIIAASPSDLQLMLDMVNQYALSVKWK